MRGKGKKGREKGRQTLSSALPRPATGSEENAAGCQSCGMSLKTLFGATVSQNSPQGKLWQSVVL